jgi:hypothetical protein
MLFFRCRSFFSLGFNVALPDVVSGADVEFIDEVLRDEEARLLSVFPI